MPISLFSEAVNVRKRNYFFLKKQCDVMQMVSSVVGRIPQEVPILTARNLWICHLYGKWNLADVINATKMGRWSLVGPS